MQTVLDSVHDHIEVSSLATDLIETPEVQRLRNIKQLGTVSMVYPSANHTRFEHSLGVYHLATEALRFIEEIEAEEAKYIEAAALLHDVGHTAFSHNIEHVLAHHTGKMHDDVHDLLRDSSVGDVLNNHDLNPDKVADYVAGDGKYGQLISGELDVDRMDYLVRDAHHTGVPYGLIDSGRLVRQITFVDGELTFREGNVQAAESLLLARAMMMPVVYTHSAAQISKSMLQTATEKLLNETDITGERLRRMDDHDLIVALRQNENTEQFMRRLDTRNLFKRAIWAEMTDVPRTVLDATYDEISTYEREIAQTAGVDEQNVIVDIPPEPSMKESSTQVVVNGERRTLAEQSPLVDALRAAQTKQWRFGVYTPQESVPEVTAATERVLGITTN